MIPRHYGFVFPVKIISGHELSGLPRTLKEAGVSRDQRDEIWATAMNDGSAGMNPVEVDLKTAQGLFDQAYD